MSGWRGRPKVRTHSIPFISIIYYVCLVGRFFPMPLMNTQQHGNRFLAEILVNVRHGRRLIRDSVLINAVEARRDRAMLGGKLKGGN